MTDNQLSSVLDKLGAVKDTMTVSRVFGESYQVDGVTIVPVATVRGGGGGGGGEGTPPGGEGTGTGAGLGFGVIVRPLGVYIVKDGEVRWQPAIDVLRVVVGGSSSPSPRSSPSVAGASAAEDDLANNPYSGRHVVNEQADLPTPRSRGLNHRTGYRTEPRARNDTSPARPPAHIGTYEQAHVALANGAP